MLSGFTLGGLVLFSMTFYIAWKCWLREKLEEMILNYCFGSWGEKIMDFMEFLGCIEDWRIRDEIKKDEEEYYGLSPEQIAICKEAKKINKIKYEEALKIRWEELAKYAKRPTDEYHNHLLKNIKKPKRHSMIELSELHKKEENDEEKIQEENYIIKISPGTPRRRRKSVKI